MFRPEQLVKAYGDYRESIGRPRVNGLEEIKDSIPYAHFVAGVNFAFDELRKEGCLSESDIESNVDFEDPLEAL